MNILLLAFALPVATILLAIVLQKILKCPLLVAATFFAVFLIVTYAVFDSSFLVFAILYTILAYVTAVLTRIICRIIARFNLLDNCNCICGRNEENGNNSAREGNYNVSNGTWCCTTRNVLGANQASANIAVNNNTNCSCENNNGVSDPVIILTNASNITTNGRNARNNCGCSRK